MIRTIAELEDFIVEMLRMIVNVPDDVATHAESTPDDRGDMVTIFVRLNHQDVGLAIGENGKHAEAFRRVVSLIGLQQLKTRVYMKIDAPKLPKNHFNVG